MEEEIGEEGKCKFEEVDQMEHGIDDLWCGKLELVNSVILFIGCVLMVLREMRLPRVGLRAIGCTRANVGEVGLDTCCSFLVLWSSQNQGLPMVGYHTP